MNCFVSLQTDTLPNELFVIKSEEKKKKTVFPCFVLFNIYVLYCVNTNMFTYAETKTVYPSHFFGLRHLKLTLLKSSKRSCFNGFFFLDSFVCLAHLTTIYGTNVCRTHAQFKLNRRQKTIQYIGFVSPIR